MWGDDDHEFWVGKGLELASFKILSRYSPGENEENHKKFSLGIRWPGHDLNWRPPESASSLPLPAQYVFSYRKAGSAVRFAVTRPTRTSLDLTAEHMSKCKRHETETMHMSGSGESRRCVGNLSEAPWQRALEWLPAGSRGDRSSVTWNHTTPITGYHIRRRCHQLDCVRTNFSVGCSTLREEHCTLLFFLCKVKVKLSRYTPWRNMGGEEV
jgi:hypothetical protein